MSGLTEVHLAATVLDYLRALPRYGVAQVALFDEINGRTYLLSDGTATQFTASIVKADIEEMWLRRNQSNYR